MTDQEVKEYKEFMWNPENSINCKACPENVHSRTSLPCGQQNCWVDCHTRAAKEVENG